MVTLGTIGGALAVFIGHKKTPQLVRGKQTT